MTVKTTALKLQEMLEASKNCIVFTGAGISTQSGIPDFRSPGGLWENNMPIDFRDFVASPEARNEAWRRKFALEDSFLAAKPNIGHKAVAHLIDNGRVSHVITQNIDNLHQASGISSDRIIELHGNGSYATCLTCHQRHEMAWIGEIFKASGAPPDCPHCGGIVKSATISFGQSMPEEKMKKAEAASLACDLFIVLGSSLVVFPAAGFPIIAKRNGAGLVIINHQETELDAIADLVAHEDIGEVIAPLMDLKPASRS
jgi:NAD-dependent protein deacetylase/lipoamidase